MPAHREYNRGVRGGPGRNAPAVGLPYHSHKLTRRLVHERHMVPQLYCPSFALGAAANAQHDQQVDEK